MRKQETTNIKLRVDVISTVSPEERRDHVGGKGEKQRSIPGQREGMNRTGEKRCWLTVSVMTTGKGTLRSNRNSVVLHSLLQTGKELWNATESQKSQLTTKDEEELWKATERRRPQFPTRVEGNLRSNRKLVRGQDLPPGVKELRKQTQRSYRCQWLLWQVTLTMQTKQRKSVKRQQLPRKRPTKQYKSNYLGVHFCSLSKVRVKTKISFR